MQYCESECYNYNKFTFKDSPIFLLVYVSCKSIYMPSLKKKTNVELGSGTDDKYSLVSHVSFVVSFITQIRLRLSGISRNSF